MNNEEASAHIHTTQVGSSAEIILSEALAIQITNLVQDTMQKVLASTGIPAPKSNTPESRIT